MRASKALLNGAVAMLHRSHGIAKPALQTSWTNLQATAKAAWTTAAASTATAGARARAAAVRAIGARLTSEEITSIVGETGALAPVEAVVDVADVADTAAADNVTASITDAEVAAAAAPAHPVFGEMMRDFGYKQVYAVPAATLIGLPVWEKQRAFRKERAEEIASAALRQLQSHQQQFVAANGKQTKNGDAKHGNSGKNGDGGDALSMSGIEIMSSWPGSITMFEDTRAESGAGGAGAFGILDGQHRVGAMRMLLESGTAAGCDAGARATVLVEVFPTHDDAHTAQLFMDINKAQPVQLVDMPMGADHEAHRATIDVAAESLLAAFPAMFSSSQKCRSPHVNVDVLRQDLFDAGIVAELGLAQEGALLDWLLARNAELGAMSDAKFIPRRRKGGGSFKMQERKKATARKAVAKARKHDFFLGLDKRWLEA